MTTTGTVTGEAAPYVEAVRELAQAFASERHERQRRRHLDPADFDRLRETGFGRSAVPRARGGSFESVERSTRPICDALRALAGGDASVALVAAMHPAVLFSGRWLVAEEVEVPDAAAWRAQCDEVFATVLAGHWWGTITSEPGSAGDLLRTRAAAIPDTTSGGYRLTGQKHFGSGSGVTSFMITTALPQGEDVPDWFVLDLRGQPWDGTTSVTLTAEWDGHGMSATQSHAFSFDGFPATRCANVGGLRRALEGVDASNPGFVPCLFTAVVVGIVQTAVAAGRAKLAPRRGGLGAYELATWTDVLQGAWLIDQAYEGMLRDTEARRGQQALRAKTAIAELAEALMTRLCRLMGGGTYARHSPFGFWFEDVRALGFLRPPWATAYASLDELAWAEEG
jgi:alkylation response protein AidB-like acyl-CoA dehydrogenase